ncbi:hypothetical protein Ahy_A05g022880 [Arachis hypogaea]|uniref:Uncharacterized protein n=1 Tax=Arachis hypogaea TaxID=3818 RepID=A0A445D1Q2_ARAHY|nr:hypothetical protein Ahy_A05g022880 [Arachis hypogaea]
MIIKDYKKVVYEISPLEGCSQVDQGKPRKFEKLAAILYHTYDNAMVKMQEHKAKSEGKCSLSHEDASLEDINKFQSPPQVGTKGPPKNKLGSNTEK